MNIYISGASLTQFYSSLHHKQCDSRKKLTTAVTPREYRP